MHKRITRIDPNNQKNLLKLADLYWKEGLKMETIEIYVDLARFYSEQKDHKKRLAMYLKILEIDEKNVKIRHALADFYLRQGSTEKALAQYLKTADIFIEKNEFTRAIRLLSSVFRKIKHEKVYEKLVKSYVLQEDDDKAIDLLKELDPEFSKNINLLKMLGELYLKKELLQESEEVFLKILRINSGQVDVAKRLAGIYLQKKEFDKAYKMFQPLIENHLKKEEFEEAESLLRLIITRNNSYLPALTKLGKVYKLSGKKKNLIVLYESLIPIYEKNKDKGMCECLLAELMNIADNPLVYKKQLEKLTSPEKTLTKLPAEKEEGADEKLQLLEDVQSMDIDPATLDKAETHSMPEQEKDKKEQTKTFEDYLSELDFFISDRYYKDAENLIQKLKLQDPNHEGLLLRIKNLKDAKLEETLPGIISATKKLDKDRNGVPTGEDETKKESAVITTDQKVKGEISGGEAGKTDDKGKDSSTDDNGIKIEIDDFLGAEKTQLEEDEPPQRQGLVYNLPAKTESPEEGQNTTSDSRDSQSPSGKERKDPGINKNYQELKLVDENDDDTAPDLEELDFDYS
jgi:tetratricopeptide (TPR) repeat protein